METTNEKDTRPELLRKAVDELRMLRDEARVRLHLASMDARTAWDQMEPAIADAEREAQRASVSALERVEATVKRLREYIAAL